MAFLDLKLLFVIFVYSCVGIIAETMQLFRLWKPKEWRIQKSFLLDFFEFKTETANCFRKKLRVRCFTWFWMHP